MTIRIDAEGIHFTRDELPELLTVIGIVACDQTCGDNIRLWADQAYLHLFNMCNGETRDS